MAEPSKESSVNTAHTSAPLRLHLGGQEVREGWKIFDIQNRPGVDFVGTVTDLSQFPDGSVAELYASHVYEHLDYVRELPTALTHAHRVLKPGGVLRIGVPDLDVLCKLMLTPGLSVDERFYVQRMLFGGQTDPFDYHKIGLNFEFLTIFLNRAGFQSVRRLRDFNLFKDCTALRFREVPISLNVIALK